MIPLEDHNDAAGPGAPLRRAIEVFAWKVLAKHAPCSRIRDSWLELALPEGIGLLDRHPVWWHARVKDHKAWETGAIAEKLSDIRRAQVTNALDRDRPARVEWIIIR